MKKQFKILIETENNFCESDLEDCLMEGIHNVGNHTIKNIVVKSIGWKYLEVEK